MKKDERLLLIGKIKSKRKFNSQYRKWFCLNILSFIWWFKKI